MILKTIALFCVVGLATVHGKKLRWATNSCAADISLLPNPGLWASPCGHNTSEAMVPLEVKLAFSKASTAMPADCQNATLVMTIGGVGTIREDIIVDWEKVGQRKAVTSISLSISCARTAGQVFIPVHLTLQGSSGVMGQAKQLLRNSLGALPPRLIPFVGVSQLHADAFAASVLRARSDLHFYLDIGAFDGELLSNTLALDRAGWHGVCVDPFPRNMLQRTCTVVHTALSGDGSTRDFMTEAGPLAGFRDSLGMHAEYVERTKNSSKPVQTMTPQAFVAQHALPGMVGYVNLDIEGSELEVLAAWPWAKHAMGVLTLEHNFEEPKRSQMRELLLGKGMQLAYEVEHDDWYVHESLAAQLAAAPVPKALLGTHLK